MRKVFLFYQKVWWSLSHWRKPEEHSHRRQWCNALWRYQSVSFFFFLLLLCVTLFLPPSFSFSILSFVLCFFLSLYPPDLAASCFTPQGSLKPNTTAPSLGGCHKLRGDVSAVACVLCLHVHIPSICPQVYCCTFFPPFSFHSVKFHSGCRIGPSMICYFQDSQAAPLSL